MNDCGFNDLYIATKNYIAQLLVSTCIQALMCKYIATQSVNNHTNFSQALRQIVFRKSEIYCYCKLSYIHTNRI